MERQRQRTPHLLQTEVCAGQTIVFHIQKGHQFGVVVGVVFWGVKTAVIHLAVLNMVSLKASDVVLILDQEIHG